MTTHLSKIKFIFLALTLFSVKPVSSQTWTVGVPVDKYLSTLTSFGGGCFPSPDFTFQFAGSITTGVNHVAIVTSIPLNAAYVNPGGININTGDTITLASGSNTYSVYFYNGSGPASFNFRAIGTPTVAGETYCCDSNDIWMSNLGICPDALSHNVGFNCTVSSFTGIDVTKNSDYSIIFPLIENNFTLSFGSSEKIKQVNIVDVNGKTVANYSNSFLKNASMDCSHLADGIYVLLITSSEGIITKNKFAIVH